MTCVVVNAAEPRNVLLIANIVALNFSLRKDTKNKSSFQIDDSTYKIIENLVTCYFHKTLGRVHLWE